MGHMISPSQFSQVIENFTKIFANTNMQNCFKCPYSSQLGSGHDFPILCFYWGLSMAEEGVQVP